MISPPHILACVVPKAQFLALCSLSCIQPLSILVLSLSLHHHLYADDIQLFLSLYLSDYQSNISHLQNALQQTSSWMTANLLTLNSSKNWVSSYWTFKKNNNFLKYRTALSLQPTPLATLVLIIDEHLTFSDQITALSISCYYHIHELSCIRPYLATIATSIVHSKLDYCNSLYHNLPKCQLNRLQKIQNSLARAVIKLENRSDMYLLNPYICKIPQITYFAIIITNIIVTHRNAR